MAWKKVTTIWMKRDKGRRARERYSENWNQKREWSQKNIHFGAVTSNFHSIYWVTRNNFYGYFVFKGRTKRTKHINDSKTPKINSEVEQTRDNDFFLLFFSLDPVFAAWSLRLDCIPYCVSSTNNQKRKMKIIIFGHTNLKCRIFVGCLCRHLVSVAFSSHIFSVSLISFHFTHKDGHIKFDLPAVTECKSREQTILRHMNETI